MTDSSWLPGLAVLFIGLAAGLYLGWRLRRQGAAERSKVDPDLDLAIRDLEERRNDLYRRLRGADEDRLGEAEREALELAAAKTLRELDQLQQKQPAAKKRKKRIEETERRIEAPASASAAPAHGRRSALVGFAFGALLVATVALLIYWAGRDARPDPQMAPGPAATVPVDEPHGDETAMSPEIAGRVAELEARVAAAPDDWMAKKELALTLMSGAQFVEAFKLSDEILRNFPEDPDALLIQGVVRMTMGQNDVAVELLDRVLAQHPDHLQALLYRGLALYQSGQTERAVDTWEMGLEMAGGRHPDFEEVLAMAAAASDGTASSATASAAPGPGVGPDTTPSSEARTDAADLAGYPVRIELAAGAMVQPGSTLFVFLRPETGGAPVAARRITGASFPLSFTLGSGDSMMGGELPKSGILVAKLDTDGSASTSSETDFQTEAEASWGEWTRLTLGR